MKTPDRSRLATLPGKPSRRRPRPDKVLSYRLADAAAIIGLSERGLAGLITAGKLRAVRVGRATLIPARELERLAEEGAA